MVLAIIRVHPLPADDIVLIMMMVLAIIHVQSSIYWYCYYEYARLIGIDKYVSIIIATVTSISNGVGYIPSPSVNVLFEWGGLCYCISFKPVLVSVATVLTSC